MNQAGAPHQEAGSASAQPPAKLLFDLSGIDLSACVADKEAIARWNPHRGLMAFLDSVVWVAPDYTRAVGLKRVRNDEFWIPGHFPEKPIYPGVFQVEAGAQLGCYIFAKRKDAPTLAAFLRIEDCAFRSMVQPGDDLYILLQDVKFQRRRFVVDIQGVVGAERIAFDARISGLAME